VKQTIVISMNTQFANLDSSSFSCQHPWRLFRGDQTGEAVLMRHYIRKTEKELFDPVELAELVGAYQKACHSLCHLGGIVDDNVRGLLARRIIEKAKTGELDQDSLCRDAMDHFAVTLLTLHQPAGLSTQAAA